MFTGLVETLGAVKRAGPDGSGGRLFLITADFVHELDVGESVAINGVCLTVIAQDGEAAAFQAGPETLARSNLGELVPGDRVNLERSLRLGDRLGGHLVQGHVDGVGKITERRRQDEWEYVWFSCPSALMSQMVPKGSIAVDGVSLTLVDVEQDRFSVALIPHTMAVTTLGFKPVGATVNLETDMFGKYVSKYLESVIGPKR